MLSYKGDRVLVDHHYDVERQMDAMRLSLILVLLVIVVLSVMPSLRASYELTAIA